MPYKNTEDRRSYARDYCPGWRKRNPEYHKNYMKRYLQIKPWAKTLININSRCGRKTHPYYRRGIKNFLTTKDLEFLWFRDKAHLLSQPSIDRIDNDGNYTLANCRYIELSENNKERFGEVSNVY